MKSPKVVFLKHGPISIRDREFGFPEGGSPLQQAADIITDHILKEEDRAFRQLCAFEADKMGAVEVDRIGASELLATGKVGRISGMPVVVSDGIISDGYEPAGIRWDPDEHRIDIIPEPMIEIAIE